LTVTDHASRYLLLCEALDSVREDTAITVASASRNEAIGFAPVRHSASTCLTNSG
jgi:hypothetical protein